MTTDELNLTEVSWGDHRVRFIKVGSGKYIPVGDIAQATGVRKRSYHNLMDKFPDVFFEHERGVRLCSPSGKGGQQDTRCIDEFGAHDLLRMISANYITDPDVRQRVIEFKEWMQIRAGGVNIIPFGKEPDYEAILRKIQFVNQLSEMTGWNKLDLQKEVLREANLQHLTWHIEPAQPALPPALEKKPKPFLTATDIGKLCGKTPEEVHKWLYQHNPPFIIKGEGDEWRLTEYGKEFAYEHPYCPPNTMILRNRIEWKPSLLEKMNIQQKVIP